MHTGLDRQTMDANGGIGVGGGPAPPLSGISGNPPVFSRSKKNPLFADFSPKKTPISGKTQTF